MAAKSLFSMALFAFATFAPTGAQYAQVSSTYTQTNGPIGTGTPLTYDSVDALSGIEFKAGGSNFTIVEPGAYFLIAAPQVAFGGDCSADTASFTADFWVSVNEVAVSNSNVRLVAPSTSTDVIVTQGVYIFNKGDTVEVLGSGECSAATAIAPGGDEPLIPSIITTMYKLPSKMTLMPSGTPVSSFMTPSPKPTVTPLLSPSVTPSPKKPKGTTTLRPSATPSPKPTGNFNGTF